MIFGVKSEIQNANLCNNIGFNSFIENVFIHKTLMSMLDQSLGPLGPGPGLLKMQPQ